VIWRLNNIRLPARISEQLQTLIHVPNRVFTHTSTLPLIAGRTCPTRDAPGALLMTASPADRLVLEQLLDLPGLCGGTTGEKRLETTSYQRHFLKLIACEAHEAIKQSLATAAPAHGIVVSAVSGSYGTLTKLSVRLVEECQDACLQDRSFVIVAADLEGGGVPRDAALGLVTRSRRDACDVVVLTRQWKSAPPLPRDNVCPGVAPVAVAIANAAPQLGWQGLQTRVNSDKLPLAPCGIGVFDEDAELHRDGPSAPRGPDRSGHARAQQARLPAPASCSDAVCPHDAAGCGRVEERGGESHPGHGAVGEAGTRGLGLFKRARLDAPPGPEWDDEDVAAPATDPGPQGSWIGCTGPPAKRGRFIIPDEEEDEEETGEHGGDTVEASGTAGLAPACSPHSDRVSTTSAGAVVAALSTAAERPTACASHEGSNVVPSQPLRRSVPATAGPLRVMLLPAGSAVTVLREAEAVCCVRLLHPYLCTSILRSFQHRALRTSEASLAVMSPSAVSASARGALKPPPPTQSLLIEHCESALPWSPPTLSACLWSFLPSDCCAALLPGDYQRHYLQQRFNESQQRAIISAVCGYATLRSDASAPPLLSPGAQQRAPPPASSTSAAKSLAFSGGSQPSPDSPLGAVGSADGACFGKHSPWTLVVGPPGTGKTTTVLGLLNALHLSARRLQGDVLCGRLQTPLANTTLPQSGCNRAPSVGLSSVAAAGTADRSGSLASQPVARTRVVPPSEFPAVVMAQVLAQPVSAAGSASLTLAELLNTAASAPTASVALSEFASTSALDHAARPASSALTAAAAEATVLPTVFSHLPGHVDATARRWIERILACGTDESSSRCSAAATASAAAGWVGAGNVVLEQERFSREALQQRREQVLRAFIAGYGLLRRFLLDPAIVPVSALIERAGPLLQGLLRLRVLVCAPSNTAVDGLLLRLAREGMRGETLVAPAVAPVAPRAATPTAAAASAPAQQPQSVASTSLSTAAASDPAHPVARPIAQPPPQQLQTFRPVLLRVGEGAGAAVKEARLTLEAQLNTLMGEPNAPSAAAAGAATVGYRGGEAGRGGSDNPASGGAAAAAAGVMSERPSAAQQTLAWAASLQQERQGLSQALHGVRLQLQAALASMPASRLSAATGAGAGVDAAGENQAIKTEVAEARAPKPDPHAPLQQPAATSAEHSAATGAGGAAAAGVGGAPPADALISAACDAALSLLRAHDKNALRSRQCELLCRLHEVSAGSHPGGTAGSGAGGGTGNTGASEVWQPAAPAASVSASAAFCPAYARNPSAAPSFDRRALRRELSHLLLAGADLVFTTTSSAALASLEAFLAEGGASFDCVVVDEATQAVEPSTLIPLRHGASRVVLVGDPMQLPPTLLSPDAAAAGYGCSLFQRLQEAGHPVHLLDTQYRSHPVLSAFPSRYLYGGRLRDHPSLLGPKRSIPLHAAPAFGPLRVFDIRYGLEELLASGADAGSAPPGRRACQAASATVTGGGSAGAMPAGVSAGTAPIGSRDAQGTTETAPATAAASAFLPRALLGESGMREATALRNPPEAEAVLGILAALAAWRGVGPGGTRARFAGSVGVISFYRGQVALLKRLILGPPAAPGADASLKASGSSDAAAAGATDGVESPAAATPRWPFTVDVATVDGFQGTERDIIILSCVRAARKIDLSRGGRAAGAGQRAASTGEGAAITPAGQILHTPSRAAATPAASAVDTLSIAHSAGERSTETFAAAETAPMTATPTLAALTGTSTTAADAPATATAAIASAAPVGAPQRSGVGFLDDCRRLNVAITRARFCCWVVGEAPFLSQSAHWAALLQHAGGVPGAVLTLRSPAELQSALSQRNAGPSHRSSRKRDAPASGPVPSAAVGVAADAATGAAAAAAAATTAAVADTAVAPAAPAGAQAGEPHAGMRAR
jgi:hypothetical protein